MKGPKCLPARQGGVWVLLSMMILISVFSCGLWGRQGWPIGSFWWDELALAGGAHAIDLGLKPTVDFWAPFIWPIYQKWFATKVAGLPGSYVAECVMQGWIVFIFFVAAVWSRRLHWMGYVAAGVLIMSAVSPFNTLSVTEARLGEISFDCSYNRLGGAIIGLVVMWIGMLPEEQIDTRRNVIWLAFVLIFSFLLKITVFQIAWLLVFVKSLSQPTQAWMRLWVKSSVVAGAGLAVVFALLGGVAGYWDALLHLSKVRAASFDLVSVVTLLILIHRFELALYLLPALLIVFWGARNERKIVGEVAWYLMSLGGFCLYTASNYGDNGLMPTMTSIFNLIACTIPKYQAVRVEREQGSLMILRRLAISCFWILIVFYASFVAWWMGSYYERSRHVPAEQLGAPGNLPGGGYAARLDSVGFVNLRALDIPINVSDPRLFAQYWRELAEANDFLRHQWPSRQTRVYALDFPAYVFSLLSDYDVPHGSYPWLLFDHELNLDHYPDAGSLLGNVDVLLSSKCSLTGGNRQWLFAMYRVYIEKNFAIVGSTRCWNIYSRKP